jgi:hypothetical protein
MLSCVPFDVHGMMLMATPPFKLELQRRVERYGLGNITTLIFAR